MTSTLVFILSLFFPPCVVEDDEPARGCLWDAAVRSNGQGLSFVQIAHTTIYLPVTQ